MCLSSGDAPAPMVPSPPRSAPPTRFAPSAHRVSATCSPIRPRGSQRCENSPHRAAWWTPATTRRVAHNVRSEAEIFFFAATAFARPRRASDASGRSATHLKNQVVERRRENLAGARAHVVGGAPYSLRRPISPTHCVEILGAPQ